MYVDPHVHLRDFKQRHKETIEHGLRVARDSGVVAVLDMPNTDPPVTTLELARERLRLAREADVPGVFYGIYMGLSADPEQVKRAVEATRTPGVVGMKLYAGHSVGNLGVTTIEDQRSVFETLADAGFAGVLAVHAEKELYMEPKRWDPQRPISHADARPPIAENESVRDLLQIVEETGFAGKLHIAHVSSPKAVDLISEARRIGFDVSCGVCPHHLIYDERRLAEPDGILWKMNPPLRTNPRGMLDRLRAGMIDWIETDHAPHTLDEKIGPPYCSGIPGLAWWDDFAAYLEREGFSPQRIEEVTSGAAIRRYGLDIDMQSLPRKDHRGDYAFDPYKGLARAAR